MPQKIENNSFQVERVKTILNEIGSHIFKSENDKSVSIMDNEMTLNELEKEQFYKYFSETVGVENRQFM